MHLVNCRIDDAKVTGYLLNDSHRDGGPKSRFFQAFGFTLSEWPVLRGALSQHPARNPVKKITDTPFGAKYEVACRLQTPDGRDPCIVTIWQSEAGVGEPRLVTAYPA